MLKHVVLTALSHYRRHPIQALFLLAGITLANLLLVATLLINAQARASYAAGQRSDLIAPPALIVAADGAARFPDSRYLALRRAGFHQLAPLLEWRARLEDGQAIDVLGIDVFASMGSKRTEADGEGPPDGILGPGFAVLASPDRMAQLGASLGQRLRLEDGTVLPALRQGGSDRQGNSLLMDIGALQTVADLEGELSAIAVSTDDEQVMARLQRALPGSLALQRLSERPDPAELTASFHLNLSAMGMLAFVVGVFLIFNALAFSYADRAELLRRMRLCGTSAQTLAAALIIELLTFAAVGILIGYLGGAWLAGMLLPGVGHTLASLYGVYIAYPDSLVGSGGWAPVAMTLAACAACAAWPMRHCLRRPLIRRAERTPGGRRQALLALVGVVLFSVGAIAGLATNSLIAALAAMACLLLGGAFLLPGAIATGLAILSRLSATHRPRLGWALADTRWLLGPASLALMAVALALMANSGLNTMIHSFREATGAWLDQRLVAGLYLDTQTDGAAIQDWLDRHGTGGTLVSRHERAIGALSPGGLPVNVEVSSVPAHPRFLQSLEFVSVNEASTSRFADGQAIVISERSHRIEGWNIGDEVEVCPGQSREIAGIYREYGNTRAQWKVAEKLFLSCWPAQAPRGRAIVFADGGTARPSQSTIDSVRAGLAREFGLADRQVVETARLREIGMEVFDRTFAITRALNLLTLLVGGIGIFCAVSAIHHHRLGTQALLAALGLSRSERGWLLAAQWGLLGLLCMIIVWPFGTALAWLLAELVTPRAFGWSFPLVLEWGHYPRLALTACVALLLAAMLPAMRLLNASPADLFRGRVH